MDKKQRKEIQKVFFGILINVGFGIFQLGLGGILLSDILDERILLNSVILVVVGPVFLAVGFIARSLQILTDTEK